MAILLPTTTITTAGTVVGSIFQLRAPAQMNLPASMTVLANFAVASGGTTANVYVQTSLDGGTTWCDAVIFGLTTTPGKFVGSINSGKSLTPVLSTDGTGTINTANDGLFGPLWRVKLISTGTYTGGTTMTVNAWSTGIVPST